MKNQEELEKQKSVIASLPGGIGIYHVYTDGRVELLYLNDDYYSWLGVPREERKKYMGLSTIDAIHPDDRSEVLRVAMETIGKEKKRNVICRIMCADEECRWVSIRMKPVSQEGDCYTVYALYSDVDELKKTQLQLENNQRSVELAQQQGNMAIWTFNIDKGIILQQTSLDVEGHMGYPVIIENVPACFIESNGVYVDDQRKFLETYQKLADGAEKVDEIYRLINRITGEYDWVHMYYQRIYNEKEKDRMAVGFSIMVNQQQENLERYLAEQQLRRKLFARAIQYFEFNLTKGKIQSHEKLASGEYDYEPMVEQTITEFVEKMKISVEESYQEDMKRLYSGNLLKSFQKGEDHVTCEYRRKAMVDKEAFWARTTAIMAQRPDSNEVMAFIYVENIDEEKKFRMALDSTMEDGIESIAIIHIKDRVTRVVKKNPTLNNINMQDVFVYDDAFVAKSKKAEAGTSIAIDRHRGELTDVIEKLKDMEVYQYSVTVINVEGKELRKLFRFRYLDQYKEDIIISVGDITELYEEELRKKQQLERAVEEAVAANRAKTDFLSRMSHDIRTPLNVIIGMNRLAQDNDNPKDTRECLEKIQISSEFLLGLINDVLDMERIESGRVELHPVPYSGTEFKSYIQTVIAPLCKEKNIEFVFDVDTDKEFIVLQDKLRINQIYFNILSNAVKFTPEGGKIIFGTKVKIEGNANITLEATISDNGIGMSEEFQKHMFAAFTQENQSRDEVRQGTGLGLAIVKKMCELMGMTVDVHSELGKGTTFFLCGTYPLVRDEGIRRKKIEKQPFDLSVLNNKMILVCEDHMLNQEIIRRLLEKEGMIPVLMDDGQKGLNAFVQSAPGEYAAILMDIRMPVMDGIETTRQIRALNRADAKQIPIIAMTANAFESDIEEVVAAGMNAHLAKPVEPDLLYNTLADWIKS